ncbi:MAG: coenzyme F420-0:L-glutamate ligase [Acidobacteria bacterium RIFCSPLOWO2_12_FULL_65_11]|nr:MAG: coenzyme F420-0:L-glutamate ligase [Acidobacteria bacterium RIFCSPLOWO2_02_FULL_64_15]OFW30015.1 MAG: coenzyme F420-0:L-glutamate ligase [Acidobacteria bacterium RIFCSPLOWO2_12_FULL_65_11]
MTSEVHIIGLKGPADITPGVDLAQMIVDAARERGLALASGDILVVTQKIVSKAEGRLVDLCTVTPSSFASEIAKVQDKDPRVVEVVLRETRRVVKMDQRTIITETHQGLVCANAGVDESNVAGEGKVALLPADADASARRLRQAVQALTGVELAVIISDTFGRPWREGFVNVAIGVAGLEPLKDYRGLVDTEGHVLKATILAVADEVASAAELVMGKLDRVPVAVVRGYPYTPGEGTATEMIRPPEKDLFR